MVDANGSCDEKRLDRDEEAEDADDEVAGDACDAEDETAHLAGTLRNDEEGADAQPSAVEKYRALAAVDITDGDGDGDDYGQDSNNGQQDDGAAPEDTGLIRCICGFDEDDGFTIACDRCYVWQHGECVFEYTRTELEEDQTLVPDQYLCDRCAPRTLDIERAIKVQIRRRETESKLENKSAPRSRRGGGAHRGRSTGNGGGTGGSDATRNSELKRSRVVNRTASGHGSVLSDTPATPAPEPEASIVSPLEPGGERMYRCEYVGIDINEIDQSAMARAVKFSFEIDNEEKVFFQGPQNKFDTPSRVIVQRLSVDTLDVYKRPQFILSAAQEFRPGDYIMEYCGYIGSKDDYRNEPVNQFNVKRIPKPRVIFAPAPINLCVDARRIGNEARFIRHCCQPNAEILLFRDDRTIRFGVFATKKIKSKTEITIGHFWEDCESHEDFVSDIQRGHLPSPPADMGSAESRAAELLKTIGCACQKSSRCLLLQLSNVNLALNPGDIEEARSNSTLHERSLSGKLTNYPAQEREDTPMTDSDAAPNPTSFVVSYSAREERKNRALVAQFERAELQARLVASRKHSKSLSEDSTNSTSQINTSLKRKRKRSKTSAEVELIQMDDSHLREPPLNTQEELRETFSNTQEEPADNLSSTQEPKEIITEKEWTIVEPPSKRDWARVELLTPRKMWLKRYLQTSISSLGPSPTILPKTDTSMTTSTVSTTPAFSTPSPVKSVENDKKSLVADQHEIKPIPPIPSIPMPPPLVFPSILKPSLNKETSTLSSITNPVYNGHLSGANPRTVPLSSPMQAKPKKLSLSEYRARKRPGESTPKSEAAYQSMTSKDEDQCSKSSFTSTTSTDEKKDLTLAIS